MLIDNAFRVGLTEVLVNFFDFLKARDAAEDSFSIQIANTNYFSLLAVFHTNKTLVNHLFTRFSKY